MNPALSRPIRRIAAVGLLIAALLVLWSTLIAPLVDGYASDRAAADRLERVLVRTRDQRQTIAALEAELADLRKHRGEEEQLLPGSNESIVAAQLQARLRMLIDRAHGELRSAQVLPATTVGHFRKITVRGNIALDLAGVQQVVYDLEAATPYLFIDSLDIKRHESESENGPHDTRLLDVNLDLSGYMRGPS